MCVSPLLVKNQKKGIGANAFTTPVPCGKCPICVKRKINAWKFRLSKEAEVHTSAFFVTLTYNEDNVPLTTSGYKTLRKRDIQLFMKRLRKKQAKVTDVKIRYYLVGEYGSKTFRPHYHAIIFGVIDHSYIEDCWQNGFTYAPPLNGDKGVGYVLKYISKPRQTFKNDEREREFSLMSKGLGANYMTSEMIKYHNRGVEFGYINKGGVKMPLPKYYKDKMYDDAFRSRLTRHLHYRAIAIQEDQERKYILANPDKNVKVLLRDLDIRKSGVTFDLRFEAL